MGNSTLPRRRGIAFATLTALLAVAAIPLVAQPASAEDGTIQGLVKDADGDPHSGGVVIRYEDVAGMWAWDANVPIGPDGTYAMAVSPGDYRLLFSPGDGVHAQVFNGKAVVLDDAPVIEVASGASVTRNMKLAVGGVIKGRLLDEEGDPIPGSSVGTMYKTETGLATFGASTDAEGRFTLPALAPTPTVLYSFDAALAHATVYSGNGFVPTDAKQLKPKPGETIKNVELVAPLGATVSGVVRTEAFTNIAGSVSAYIQDESGDWVYLNTDPLEWGSYSIAGLPPVPILLRFYTSVADYRSSFYFDNRVLQQNATLLELIPGASVIANGTFFTIDGAVTAGTVTITGVPRVGETLTAVLGAGWSPDIEVTYAWNDGEGNAIPGADDATYKLRASDLGTSVGVWVGGVRVDLSYTEVGEYLAPAVVEPGIIQPAPVPRISGKAKVGKTLTAKPGDWMNGVDLSYRWFANGTKISGEKKAKLKLTGAQRGKKITLSVLAEKNGYEPRSKASDPTSKVSN